MAASSKTKKQGRGGRKKARDFSLNIETPFGKANLNHKSSRAVRESISVPVAKGTRTTSRGQKVTTSGRTETVEGSGTFITIPTSPELADHGLSAPVNPGLSEFFPWLSKTAQQFSRYMFNRLIFTFISRVPTTSIGDFLLMGDPNVQNPLPSTFVDAVSFEGAVFGNVWTRLSFDAKLFCHQPKYVRLGPLSEGQDSKTYDAGIIGYLLSGFLSDISVGYITVDYSVTFMDRRIPPETGCYVSIYNYPFNHPASQNLDIFEQPNPNPIIQTYTKEDGTWWLGFPKGLWLVAFTYVPTSPIWLEPTSQNFPVGFLLDFNSDRARKLTSTDTPLGVPFGTESFLRGGRAVDTAGGTLPGYVSSASAYWAVLANSSAIPIQSDFPHASPPAGWINSEFVTFGGNNGTIAVTVVCCRLPDSYGSYLGFDPGVPIIYPRANRSELRPLIRRFKKLNRVSPLTKASDDEISHAKDE